MITFFQGSYELSNSNDYGESIAMKFKFNIAKTGLPDGEIIVGDWYEGENANLVPILTCNPLITRVRLLQNSLYRSHKILCF